MDSGIIISKHPNETKKLGSLIAPILKRGDIIILDGNLGTGKTHFVKSIAAALQYEELVTSPTFAIANFYEAPSEKILHIDAYRIDSINEFRALGLYEYFPESIVLIEWGTKFIEDFERYFHIKFDYVDEHDEHRKISLSAKEIPHIEAFISNQNINLTVEE